MILWRTDMSVLTRISFPKLVFWIAHRLECVRGLFFFMKYLYFHVASPGSFRINRSNIFFSTFLASSILFIAWSSVAILQSSQVRAAASAKTPKGLTTALILSSASESNILLGQVASFWTSESPRLSIYCSLSSEMWALILKDSAHWLKAVTVLVVPTIHPPIPNFISLGFVCIYFIEIGPALFYNPGYNLEWDFGFWRLIQVLRTGGGVWPWYFPVIQVSEGLPNLKCLRRNSSGDHNGQSKVACVWRSGYGVPIFHLSVPVCTLQKSSPWSYISTGGKLRFVAPDFNKSVKPISKHIWYNYFIILAVCYLKVSHSLGVLGPQDREQLWKKDFLQGLWCYLFCLLSLAICFSYQGIFRSFLPKQTSLCQNR